MGIHLGKDTLDSIQAMARNIHHGRIIININTDKPDRVDVEVEYRERFRGVPLDMDPTGFSGEGCSQGNVRI